MTLLKPEGFWVVNWRLPVRFADQVEALYGAGARCFIEVGPGSVLTDLVNACLAGRAHCAVATNAHGRDSLSQFWFALGRLATREFRLIPPSRGGISRRSRRRR